MLKLFIFSHVATTLASYMHDEKSMFSSVFIAFHHASAAQAYICKLEYATGVDQYGTLLMSLLAIIKCCLGLAIN